jgi:hypothetical protein
MCETTVNLALSLAPGPGPVAGVLDTGSEQLEFTGWIELTALIEDRRALSAQGREAPPPARAES